MKTNVKVDNRKYVVECFLDYVVQFNFEEHQDKNHPNIGKGIDNITTILINNIDKLHN